MPLTLNGAPFGLDPLEAADQAMKEHAPLQPAVKSASHDFDFDADTLMRAQAEKQAKELTRFPQQDERRYRLHLIDAILRGSDLPAPTQAAVALLAATLAVSRVSETSATQRGAIINSATDDFRTMLQKYLPQKG